MSTPKVMHALLVEPTEPLEAGKSYLTICGIYWEHQPLTKEEVRERFVCALCHHEQVDELLVAIQDIQTNYNLHLNAYHPKRIEPTT